MRITVQRIDGKENEITEERRKYVNGESAQQEKKKPMGEVYTNEEKCANGEED